MTHHTEARYDEADHLFLPPLRTLGFNPQLTMNDSLLVQSYVEAYDMSYPEALRRIEDEVNELKQHLENEGSYELNDIGRLSLNENGKYTFIPCEAGILTPGLYGLSSFEMRPMKAVPVEVAEATGPSVAEEAAPVTEETVQEPEAQEPEGEGAIIIKMSWIRNAVAVAAAVLAFFLMTTPVSNSGNSHQAVSNLNSPILMGMLPKDSNMEKIDIKKKEIKSDKEVEEAKETVVERDTLPTYCIVLASYVTKKNAGDFVDRLQKRGYQEAEVFVRNKVTRVIYGHFKTENEAYNKLNSIHNDPDFEEAWVLKVKDRS